METEYNSIRETAALNEAVRNNHHKRVKELIKAGADVNDCELGKDAALITAVSQGFIKCLKILIKAGADVNVKALDGDPAIVQAVTHGRHRCLEMLIKAGADVNARGFSGSTAINRNFKCLKCLKALVKAKADVNVKGCSGNTPLIKALNNRDNTWVKYLIKEGADVNIIGSDGDSALNLAIRQGDDKTVTWLVKAGADVNMKGTDGDLGTTALMMSTSSNRAIRLLLRAEAYVNKTRSSGENSLSMYLTKSKHVNHSSAMLLLSAGEKIDRINIQSSSTTDGCSMLSGWVETEDLGPLLEEEPLSNSTILNYMRMLVDEKSLKNICRQAIRKCMINANPYPSLFTRVPRLGLPPSLEMNLLYDTTLSADHETKLLSS